MLSYVDTLIGFAGVMLLLSLLVTVVVQLASDLLQLRGRALEWGIECIIKRAVPALKGATGGETARSLAERVVRDEALSSSWGRAKAIRSDELLRILAELAAERLQRHEDARQAHDDAVTKLELLKNAPGVRPDADIAAAQTAVEATLLALKKAAAQSFTQDLQKARDGAERVYATLLQSDIVKLFPDDAEKIKKVVDQFTATAQNDMARFQAWFDTVMDRTTEMFTRWTQGITLGVAVALAVVLQIDSLGMLQQLSSNPDLRARVAQSAEATLKVADDFRAKDQPLATQALTSAIQDKGPDGKPITTMKPPVPDDLRSRQDGRAWIADKVPEGERDAVTRAFEKAYDALLPDGVKRLAATATEINKNLHSTDLIVMSKLTPFAEPWRQWWCDWHHLVGVLLTALFLSLGGPFWYNLLRQLGSLRPLLAGKVEKTDG